MNQVTELHVNGAKRPLQADAERSLLSVLRDDLDLTGSKYGCGEGRCGACTVLIDGQPVGEVTSGNFSPMLGHGIALAFLPPAVAENTPVTIESRGESLAGQVVKLPFWRR